LNSLCDFSISSLIMVSVVIVGRKVLSDQGCWNLDFPLGVVQLLLLWSRGSFVSANFHFADVGNT
jgi:hypothetical protein